MSELRLTRSPEDRKLFFLAGVGTIRNGRWFKRSAELCAENGDSWQVDRRGFRARPVFTDGVGGEPARFEAYGSFNAAAGWRSRVPARTSSSPPRISRSATP